MSSDGKHWQPPPTELQLGADEVHVWRIGLDVPEATVQRLLATLDPTERERADRYRGRTLKRRFAVSHGIVRSVLGRILERAPESLRFREGENGKPELALPGDLHFNLSHSHEVALCALTRGRRLGIDVERLREMADAGQVAERFFSDAEGKALAALPEADRQRAFFDVWTRKEAFIKARGETVFGWLRRFEVSLLPNDAARIVRVDDDPVEAGRWSLHALAPTPGYVGALAVEGHDHRLRFFRWP